MARLARPVCRARDSVSIIEFTKHDADAETGALGTQAVWPPRLRVNSSSGDASTICWKIAAA